MTSTFFLTQLLARTFAAKDERKPVHIYKQLSFQPRRNVTHISFLKAEAPFRAASEPGAESTEHVVAQESPDVGQFGSLDAVAHAGVGPCC